MHLPLSVFIFVEKLGEKYRNKISILYLALFVTDNVLYREILKFLDPEEVMLIQPLLLCTVSLVNIRKNNGPWKLSILNVWNR